MITFNTQVADFAQKGLKIFMSPISNQLYAICSTDDDQPTTGSSSIFVYNGISWVQRGAKFDNSFGFPLSISFDNGGVDNPTAVLGTSSSLSLSQLQ